MNKKIKAVVYNLAKGVITKKEVAAISSVNKEGPFDVLPQHANFISIIKNELILYPTLNSPEKIPLKLGIFKFIKNEAKIYLSVEQTVPKTTSKTSQPENQ